MSRIKGTQKTGGRGKGTPNKVTTDLRAWINKLLDNNRKQIADDIKMLEPQQRVMFFEKLLSYAVPKMGTKHCKSLFYKAFSLNNKL